MNSGYTEMLNNSSILNYNKPTVNITWPFSIVLGLLTTGQAHKM